MLHEIGNEFDSKELKFRLVVVEFIRGGKLLPNLVRWEEASDDDEFVVRSRVIVGNEVEEEEEEEMDEFGMGL